jgi:hypothetical protein
MLADRVAVLAGRAFATERDAVDDNQLLGDAGGGITCGDPRA